MLCSKLTMKKLEWHQLTLGIAEIIVNLKKKSSATVVPLGGWLPTALVSLNLSKVNNEYIKTVREICSWSTVKIPERRHWPRFGFFIVNFQQVNAGWVGGDESLIYLFINFNLTLCYPLDIYLFQYLLSGTYIPNSFDVKKRQCEANG